MLRRMVEAWGMPEQRAERLIADWEREAQRRSLPPLSNEYWPDAEAWMAGRRR
jgi:hypothetical protein